MNTAERYQIDDDQFKGRSRLWFLGYRLVDNDNNYLSYMQMIYEFSAFGRILITPGLIQ